MPLIRYYNAFCRRRLNVGIGHSVGTGPAGVMVLWLSYVDARSRCSYVREPVRLPIYASNLSFIRQAVSHGVAVVYPGRRGRGLIERVVGMEKRGREKVGR